ncbi:VWA domain-containing protein [Caldivirga sp.]|uniref:vWA domain-containing protein n=1 Tax=Caldivirga sp. TaxID=2080243 RepID=UPI0025BC3892|nr:VWA domain-containing protein [Caldivirga sp.]
MSEPEVSPQVPKLPLVLVLDTSYSMSTQTMEGKRRIDNLIEALSTLKQQILNDQQASRSVEVMIYKFGGTVDMLQDFSSISSLDIEALSSKLTPNGDTPFFKAIKEAISKARERREYYKSQGLMSYVPWVWVLTDGEPTDGVDDNGNYTSSYNDAISLLKDLIANRRINFFMIITGHGNDLRNGAEILFNFVSKPTGAPPPIMMDDVSSNWQKMAIWLSKSISKTSSSKPGQQTQAPPVDFGQPFVINV